MASPEDQHNAEPQSTPIPPPILILPNCLVRALHPSDAAQLALTADSPLIARNMRNTFPSPYTIDAAHAWIARATGTQPIRDFGVFSPDGRTLLGGVGLRPFADVECRALEVGYWIAPSAWGRGLATEVARAVSRWAFETFAEIVRLESVIYSTNEASSRVLVKAGFVYEGTRRKAVFKNGEILDLKIYGLLREECLGDAGE